METKSVNTPYKRNFPNFLEAFQDFALSFGCPAKYAHFAGIHTIAAALERRVWVRVKRGKIYPNMYLLFVGGPATGKTTASNAARIILRTNPVLCSAPDDVTKASLIDWLSTAKRTWPEHELAKRPADDIMYHAGYFVLREFNSAMPTYDVGFLSALNIFYDCEEDYVELRRHRKEQKLTITQPCLNLLGGIQPKMFARTFPDDVFQQGFGTRTDFIYISGRDVLPGIEDDPLAHETSDNSEIVGMLSHDLEIITHLCGEFSLADEAAREWFKHFYNNYTEMKPIPSDPALSDVPFRRFQKLCKYSIIYSAARGEDKTITVQDLENAKKALFSCELDVAEVRETMIASQDEAIIQAIKNWFHLRYVQLGVAVPEVELKHYISRKVEVHRVNYFVTNLLDQGFLKKDETCEREVRKEDGTVAKEFYKGYRMAARAKLG